MTRTIDQIADELTDRLTARIVASGDGAAGVEVLIDGERLQVTSDRFREVIEKEFWQMAYRGIRPAVRAQVVRNVEAWVRYGPPNGGEQEGSAA